MEKSIDVEIPPKILPTPKIQKLQLNFVKQQKLYIKQKHSVILRRPILSANGPVAVPKITLEIQ